MFFFWPLLVKSPDGSDRIPWANALLIVVNVLVFVLLTEAFGWNLAVGRGSGLLTIVTYGFAHADPWHLIVNMWFLWLFGNPVNRRLGNGYYLLSYLGTITALGIVAWLFLDGRLIGASGAVFAVMLLFMMLMPRAVVQVGYVALFPVTLPIGLFSRPKHWVFWFLRWDAFQFHAWIGFVLIAFLEVWSLWSGLWAGQWNWTNVGHLFGVLCGVVIVLLLPTEITMNRRLRAGGESAII
jgi:membrane associated rhomboid family serine protease